MSKGCLEKMVGWLLRTCAPHIAQGLASCIDQIKADTCFHHVWEKNQGRFGRNSIIILVSSGPKMNNPNFWLWQQLEVALIG